MLRLTQISYIYKEITWLLAIKAILPSLNLLPNHPTPPPQMLATSDSRHTFIIKSARRKKLQSSDKWKNAELATMDLTFTVFGGIFTTMKIVLDTNILVAATKSSRGASYRLLQLIPDSRFQICISLPLYLEYLDVLTRPEHRPNGLSVEQVNSTVRYLVSQAHLQAIYFHWRPFLPDSDDDMILELAAAASATKIVTFNLKDFRGIETFGATAIKPRDFLVEIGEIK